ncbi:MAG: hypothetical protein ACI30H_01665, partial [Paludibacteraceae bacterium]
FCAVAHHAPHIKAASKNVNFLIVVQFFLVIKKFNVSKFKGLSRDVACRVRDKNLCSRFLSFLLLDQIGMFISLHERKSAK